MIDDSGLATGVTENNIKEELFCEEGCGGSRARSISATGSQMRGTQDPVPKGYVGSNPTPRTRYGKTLRGFIPREMRHCYPYFGFLKILLEKI